MKEPEPVRFGDMAEYAKQILADALGRVRELVIDLTDGLTDEIANYRPDTEANSIAWLIWHLTRGQDHQVAELAQVEQVWPQWRERFGLPFDTWATGYGHGPEEVAAVRVSGDLLGDYHRDVHELTLRYLDRLTAEELDRIVDTRWDPPVTAAVRLVSVMGTRCSMPARLATCAVWRTGGTGPGISRVLPTTSQGPAPRAWSRFGSGGRPSWQIGIMIAQGGHTPGGQRGETQR